MDFFVWQGARGTHSETMDDERNAARWKKTRAHGLSVPFDFSRPGP